MGAPELLPDVVFHQLTCHNDTIDVPMRNNHIHAVIKFKSSTFRGLQASHISATSQASGRQLHVLRTGCQNCLPQCSGD